MQKKSFLLVLFMVLMMIPFSVTAQLPKNRIPAELQKAMLATKASKMGAVRNGKSKALKTSIKFPKALGKQAVKSPFAQALKSFKAPIAKSQKNRVQLPKNAPAFLSLNPIGYVNYSNVDESLVSNFCEFSPFSGTTVVSTAPCSYSPSAGGAIIDDTYFSFYVDDTYASWFGMYFYYILGFDTETWEIDETKTASLDYNDNTNYVFACAKTADDKLFALTSNANMDGMEFAIFTLGEDENGVVTVSRETICDAPHIIICMTSTKNGVIYAIAEDNALYTIDASTGAMTKVGDTGFTAYTDSYYGQSMCYNDKEGKLIWFAVAADASETPILEVNTTTGATSEYIPTSGITQVFGAVVPAPAAEDDAPAAISDLAVDITAPSLQGVVSFTMPTTTYAGSALTGTLNYNIVLSDGTAISGTGEAGAKITENATFQKGSNMVYVTTSNETGLSPKSNKVSFWAGYDVPLDPENVVATLGEQTDNIQKVSIQWDSVNESVHGEEMSNVTYNVYEFINGEVAKTVATGITETSVVDEIEIGDLAVYKWEVEAVNGDTLSNLSISNTLSIGKPLQIPVSWGDASNGFTEDEFNFFSVVDANEDGSTWGYSSTLQYSYNSNNNADDWAFTPKMAVKAGKTYYVRYYASSYSEYWPEKLEVKYGNAATVEAMTNTGVEEYEVTESQENMPEKTFEVTVSEDGTLVVGFHALSDADQFNLLLWKVSVEKAPEKTAPAAIEDLAVTPGEKGQLSATINFTAPTKNIAGTEVAPLTKIEIYRNDSIITTLDNVKAGDACQYIDEVPENGTYTYKVIAYNEYENGAIASASAYIGMDSPTNVEDAMLTDNITSILVNWTKVGEVGQNGGYVDPTQVTYEIYTVENGYIGEQVFSGVDTNTATLSDVNTDEGEPGLIQYAIHTTNAVGESKYYGTSSIVGGAIQDTPLTEPFLGGTITNYWWLSATSNGTWSLGDDGACFMEANAGDISWLSTAKLNIQNLSTPGVVFEVKQAAGVKFSVTAMSRDGVEETISDVYESTATEDEAQWETKIITIPEEWKSKDFVILRLKAEAITDVPDPYMLNVRNFMVRNIVDDDLSVTLSTPASVLKGQAIIGHATVTNEGIKPAKNYTVKVTCGNQIISEQTVEDELAPFATRIFNFGIPTSIFDENDATQIVATVTYDGDFNEENNEYEAEVALETSSVTPVSNLTATIAEGDNLVYLTWDAAESTAEARTEGFEDYDNCAAFPITENPDQADYFTDWNKVGTLGPWTAYDLDGGAIYGWTSTSINFPYMGYGMGFCVLDYNEVFSAMDDPSTMAHDGTKSLFCMNISPATDGVGPTNNNDWLISSALPGTAQTISFYTREITDSYGAETFEILYSTTDMETASFTKLADGEISSTEWAENTYNLPEGTKYFAIRVTSSDIFGAMFDDIQYTALGDAPVSFNIYRDGQALTEDEARMMTGAKVNVTGHSYTVVEPEIGQHTYSVTAVYANGMESVPVSTEPVIVTSVKAVNGQVAKDIIYSVDGAKVSKAKSGVNVINGKTTLVK